MAALAARAHGVVTRRDLLRAGVTRDEVSHRLRIGALIPEYPGVYRVGHRAPSVEARYIAAVKACGDGSVLAGRAAAHLLSLLKGSPPEPEVIALTQRRVAGITVHHSRRFVPQDRTVWRRIPVTIVPRTLVDLAAVLDRDELARACHEAGVRFRTTPAQVEAVLARRRNSAGAAKLRLVIRGEARVTLSKPERRFLELLREVGLPLPHTNCSVGGRRVDCHWPRQRLTVELDSYRFHNSRHAWEQDRRREREARARGDEFRRYSFGDVFEEPQLMLAELQLLLAHGPQTPARARVRR
jgi:very-short-patch-repair endonuclease